MSDRAVTAALYTSVSTVPCCNGSNIPSISLAVPGNSFNNLHASWVLKVVWVGSVGRRECGEGGSVEKEGVWRREYGGECGGGSVEEGV